MKPDINLKNKSGIYIIENSVDGKIYIGRTKCFYKRCYQYLYDFKHRNIGHLNDYIYRAMKKHGIDNFSFKVLEYCVVEMTPERELYWIISRESNHRLKGYNIRLDVNGSMVTSAETSNRISARLKREWSEGLRDGHSEKLKIAWGKRDRKAQSEVMRKALTKYEYHIDDTLVVNYKKLSDLGLKNALVQFKRKSSDVILCKGHTIERKRVSNV